MAFFRVKWGFLKWKCMIFVYTGDWCRGNAWFLGSKGDSRSESVSLGLNWWIFEKKKRDFRVKWGIFQEKMPDFGVKWGIFGEIMHDLGVNGGFSKRKCRIWGLNGGFSKRKCTTFWLNGGFSKRRCVILVYMWAFCRGNAWFSG